MNNVQFDQLLIQLIPAVIIIGVIIFLTSKVKKRNRENLNELKEQNDEKYKKVKIYESYLRLIVMGLAGAFLAGAGTYNYLKFPEQPKILPISIAAFGIAMIAFGLRSYISNRNIPITKNK